MAKAAEETKAEEKIKTEYEVVEGVGVLVTSFYKDGFAQNFISGAKVKDGKLVSILND